ncbi:MAG: hypothetical protein NTY46_05890 [Candidatus Sumerlaeota bacterium]|nr:hypothetical protein [Candidatus Sumerlaeota bacterium]
MIHIRIIHTEADMGGLGKAVQHANIRRMGRVAWLRKVTAANQMWRGIEAYLERLPLDYTKVRIYQDSMPVCGHEMGIVAELAAAGSRNHQLLLKLVNKEAKLMGTEEPELLLDEYELMKQILVNMAPTQTSAIHHKQGVFRASLLNRRDEFIARRINDTLLDGETGLLFLGILHSPLSAVAPDIKVLVYPDNQKKA